MCQRITPKGLAGILSLVFFAAIICTRGATLPAGFIDIVVASGFTNVSSMAIAPDGRIFVCQQNGRVRVIKNGAVLPSSFVSLGVNTANERGLVGIAIDPGFETNNFIYLHYTTNAGAQVVQRVSRFTANGDVVAAGSELLLIETDPFSDDQEVGGGLGVGADGMLYVGIGQCGLQGSVQTTNNLWGKILRIQRDGAIPSDNPFFNQNTGKNRAVWALGLRNPFVIALQPGTGRLFINDVGTFMTTAREEINEGVAGANYGWPTCEGACGVAAFRNPTYAYPHTNNLNAITGGTFYNGALFPTQYVGKYFFGDLNTAVLYLLDPSTTNVTPFASRLVGRLVSLKVGPDGALYYLVQSVTGAGTGGGMVGKIIPGAQTLFSLGATWKYLDTGITNIPVTWTQLGFDDSTWSNGLAQFGYGDGGETTLIRSTRSNATRIVTTYFRKAFVPTNTAFYSHFVVSLVRDDGAIVYLNGSEIFRSNMPIGPVTSETLAPLAAASSMGADEESATFGVVVPRSLLATGTNLLAVELHQQAAASSDVSFDLAFSGLSSVPVLVANVSGGNIVLQYPSWAPTFTLESSAAVPSPIWNTVTNAPMDNGGILEVTIANDGTQQFFRLRSP
jgi:glucose/arabinose dehydrogenase